MAIDFKEMGFTKQTWILLAVLVLAVGVAYYLTFPAATPAATPVTIPAYAGPPAGTGIQSSPGQTPQVAAVAGTTASGRDPFLVPAAYRQPDDQGALTMTASTVSPTTKAGGGTAQLPQLQGTVQGNAGEAAILSLGDKSQSVRVGEMIGDYTLLEVGKNYAIVAGPGGSMTLRVGR